MLTKGKHRGLLGRVACEARAMVHVKLSSGKVVTVWKTSVKKIEEPEASSSMAGSNTVIDTDTETALRLLMSSLTQMGINPASQQAQNMFLSTAQTFNKNNNINN